MTFVHLIRAKPQHRDVIPANRKGTHFNKCPLRLCWFSTQLC